ncbi:MAG TPA: hypothetical protein DDY13_04065 [Cytophagales bacterium]|nr:hypothetical protein [Cytophagales bacterium]
MTTGITLTDGTVCMEHGTIRGTHHLDGIAGLTRTTDGPDRAGILVITSAMAGALLIQRLVYPTPGVMHGALVFGMTHFIHHGTTRSGEGPQALGSILHIIGDSGMVSTMAIVFTTLLTTPSMITEQEMFNTVQRTQGAVETIET